MPQGQATVTEYWEDGYALKDFNRRNEELTEKKEELEKRRKKLTSMKRAAKKEDEGSLLGDVDLDILAETEAIRYHAEQLKR
jgi:NADP-dependent 3-hydroxy acid dehydrogenase YdfG